MKSIFGNKRGVKIRQETSRVLRNKRGEGEGTPFWKVVALILLVAVVVIVIIGLSTGSLNPLTKQLKDTFNNILALFGKKDSGTGGGTTFPCTILGKERTCEMYNNGCKVDLGADIPVGSYGVFDGKLQVYGDVFVSKKWRTDDFYFRYNSMQDIWQWSPDRENWMNVPGTVVKGGKYDGETPAGVNVDIIKGLSGQYFENGKKLLLGAKEVSVTSSKEFTTIEADVPTGYAPLFMGYQDGLISIKNSLFLELKNNIYKCDKKVYFSNEGLYVLCGNRKFYYNGSDETYYYNQEYLITSRIGMLIMGFRWNQDTNKPEVNMKMYYTDSENPSKKRSYEILWTSDPNSYKAFELGVYGLTSNEKNLVMWVLGADTVDELRRRVVFQGIPATITTTSDSSGKPIFDRSSTGTGASMPFSYKLGDSPATDEIINAFKKAVSDKNFGGNPIVLLKANIEKNPVLIAFYEQKDKAFGINYFDRMYSFYNGKWQIVTEVDSTSYEMRQKLVPLVQLKKELSYACGF